MDYCGAFLILSASILLVAALAESGNQYFWSSATVLSMLCLSAATALAFVAWIRFSAYYFTVTESIVPWRLASSRFALAALLNALLVGAVIIGVVVNIPQKFQAVDGSPPFKAGYHLLPLTLSSPLGSAFARMAMQKFKVPPLYLLLTGACVQIVGMALMTTIPVWPVNTPAAEYGYEVIIGLGIGANLSISVMITPLGVEEEDVGESSQLHALVCLPS